jgi:hypothetical protein
VPADPKRSRFLYGILFAWVPCLPLITSMASDIRSSRSKAIGLGAVASGLSEALLTLVPLCAIVAIVLLARSFARGHRLRAIVASISILWSSLVLCLLGLSAWLIYTHR